ncbi:MAG: DUF1109 family protein [Alphaproteobacteria bacterium]|nr:DUF1109 family protein [Alphaproteobacteria bacterium]
MARQTQDINAFIETLADHFDGAAPLPFPLWRVSPWIVGAVLYFAAALFWIGLRPDFAVAAQNPVFLFDLLLPFVLSVSAALCSAWLCIPDMRGAIWMSAVPLGLLGAFCLWIGTRIFLEGFSPDLHAHPCTYASLPVVALPVAALVFLMRRGAGTRPLTMATMNVLAVGGMGWIVLRLICANDSMGHLCLHHFLPYLLLGICAGGIARRLYRW